MSNLASSAVQRLLALGAGNDKKRLILLKQFLDVVADGVNQVVFRDAFIDLKEEDLKNHSQVVLANEATTVWEPLIARIQKVKDTTSINLLDPVCKDIVGKFLAAHCLRDIKDNQYKCLIDLSLHHAGAQTGVYADDIVLKTKKYKDVTMDAKTVTCKMPRGKSWQIACGRPIRQARSFFVVMWKRGMKHDISSWKELLDQISLIAVVDARELVSYQDKDRFRINYHKCGDDPDRPTQLAKKVKNKVHGYAYLRLVAKHELETSGSLPLGCLHDKVFDWIRRCSENVQKE